MKNILILTILGVACLTSYLANRAVNTTAATHDAQVLALSTVGAMEHFKTLADEAVKMLAKQMQRTAALEQYIEANGLPVPAAGRRPFDPGFDAQPDEKIIGIDIM